MNTGEQRKPVIFTNIDGVLHPHGAVLMRDGTVRMRDDRYVLFQWSGPLIEIVREFNADVVLRSSWTSRLPLYQVLSLMPPQLASAVAGVTQPIATSRLDRTQCRSRYEVVREYVAWQGFTRWVALDDVLDCWPDTERERLVLCDESGLSRLLTELELRERLLRWRTDGSTDAMN
ncbi:HAD domain-containing protein [Burkholderia pseudomallei]|uniref:HAD domain-containing protein n=2 Tax=Burkholderia pseudomallei TaxID=28450 RepID=UPI0018A6ADA1|nr:hypothetical protein KEX46_14340 [Burkholderia pseudomallei]